MSGETCEPDVVTTAPSTTTLPEAIQPWAVLRSSNQPRSSKSASSRNRGLAIALPRELARQRQQGAEAVGGGGLVRLDVAATLASMDDRVLVALLVEPDRRHQALAGGGAVAGIDVDVLAPQARGAVVGVARTAHLGAAALADEILDRSTKVRHPGSDRRAPAKCQSPPRGGN